MFFINTQAISCVSMCTRQTPSHHPLHSYRHLYSKQCEAAVCINGYFYNVYSDILLLTSRNFVPKVSNKPPYWPRDPLSENTIKKFMSAGNKNMKPTGCWWRISIISGPIFSKWKFNKFNTFWTKAPFLKSGSNCLDRKPLGMVLCHTTFQATSSSFQAELVFIHVQSISCATKACSRAMSQRVDTKS